MKIMNETTKKSQKEGKTWNNHDNFEFWQTIEIMNETTRIVAENKWLENSMPIYEGTEGGKQRNGRFG